MERINISQNFQTLQKESGTLRSVKPEGLKDKLIYFMNGIFFFYKIHVLENIYEYLF